MTKYLKLALFAIPAILALALCLTLSGCNAGTGTNTDPSKVSNLIQMGTSTAVAMGFIAIPDQAEATQIATLTEKTIDTEVLPILNGDEAGLIAGLQQILTLKAFNDPSLAKAKAILSAAIPLLDAYLPPDVLSGQTNKIPADVKAYLLAFFTGASQGCADFLPPVAGAKATRGQTDYHELRMTLIANGIPGPVKVPEKTAK